MGKKIYNPVTKKEYEVKLPTPTKEPVRSLWGTRKTEGIMNLDELFEKCRLTAGEVRHYLVTGCGLDGSANCWYSVDIDDWLVIARAQLRKAIPIIQKAERERIGRMLGMPPGDSSYCLECLLQGVSTNPTRGYCWLFGYDLEWDYKAESLLRCEKCKTQGLKEAK